MIGMLGDMGRLSRAGLVFAREGALRFVPAEKLPWPARLGLWLARLIERGGKASRPQSFSKALNRLGPSWIKLGQFLSTRPDIVGASMAGDLTHLQDRLPPFAQKLAERKVERALGRPLHEVFASFGTPVAAASIAQVHRAQLRTDGAIEDVAVKVLRPGIERRFARDMRGFFTAAKGIEFFSPAARRLRPVGVAETLAHSVAVEMDLRLEAAALSEMAENTKGDDGFVVPRVKWEAVAQDVLTTEWIDGIPLNDMQRLRAAGLDLKMLAQGVMRNFLKHALRDGFFHADMHQGNLLADPQGRIVAVDFGIMGRLTEKERRFLAEILYGFITRDYVRGANAHFDAGYVPASQSRELFAQALRAIGEPIHQKKASEISMARVLGQLLEYTELFGMETRLELIMLQKTMAVTEGVARSLDPDFDMWETARPVVEEWMRDNLGPKGQAKLAARALQELSSFVRDLPEHLQTFREMTKDGIRLSPESLAHLARAQRQDRVQAAALWAIALILFAFLFL